MFFAGIGWTYRFAICAEADFIVERMIRKLRGLPFFGSPPTASVRRYRSNPVFCSRVVGYLRAFLELPSLALFAACLYLASTLFSRLSEFPPSGVMR